MDHLDSGKNRGVKRQMINLTPIGIAYNDRLEIEDDNWGQVTTTIEIDERLPGDSLHGLEEFSHAEILYYFHKVNKAKIVSGARHPRNNEDLPKVGIFAQRGKNRPNQLGVTIVTIVKREGNQLVVRGLDCINGTPILDIKPVLSEFLPNGSIRQPTWTHEIMKRYW